MHGLYRTYYFKCGNGFSGDNRSKWVILESLYFKENILAYHCNTRRNGKSELREGCQPNASLKVECL